MFTCAQVDSKDSLENVESKWLAEIGENCPGAKIVVVALKCDLREEASDEKDDGSNTQQQPKPVITYSEGLEVAKRINALRYLGAFTWPWYRELKYWLEIECSAMRNRGVNEAFTEAARVALSVKPAKASDRSGKCVIQ